MLADTVALGTENCQVRGRWGVLSAPMLKMPSGDLVQCAEAHLVRSVRGRRITERVPSGTLWRPCTALAKRTGGKTTHQQFNDIFAAVRAGWHIGTQYGTGFSPERASERKEVLETVASARALVQYLLMARLYDSPSQKRVLERAQAQLIRRRRLEIADEKVTARERFIRGIEPLDRLGRQNLPAAAMATGGGIQHLLTRLNQITAISARVDRKTLVLFREIERHMELYTALWNDVRESEHLEGRGLFQRLIDIVDNMSRSISSTHESRERAWKDLIRILTEYRDAFASIVVRPFCVNAHYAVLDIEAALQSCERGHVPSLREDLRRLRRGSRWVFALHTLHTNVIVPLSCLLHRLHLQERKRRREEEISMSKRLVIGRDRAPEEFARIESQLQDVRRRLAKCSDTGLRVPVSERVTTAIDLAMAAFKQDAFLDAKRYLLQAAAAL